MSDSYDREAMRWPRDRVTMTKPQKAMATGLAIIEIVKMGVEWIRSLRRPPRRLDATEHPLRSERIPEDAVRESGGMGVGDADE